MGFKKLDFLQRIKIYIPAWFRSVYKFISRKRSHFRRVCDQYIEIKRLIPKLKRDYIHIIEKYNSEQKVVTKSTQTNYFVWVMWWQGEENMPDIIRINYINLKKQLNGNHLILITSENYDDYIQLPDYVLEKLKNGIISLTHLSDLIRVMLLSKFGGLWLDSTVYVVKPLPNKINFEYWTIKWELTYFQYFRFPIWVAFWQLSSIKSKTISQFMGIWYANSLNPIFTCLAEFWLEYWKNENNKPYYWTTEVFLNVCMYDSMSEIKKMIDKVPNSNNYCFDLAPMLNNTSSYKVLEKYFSTTEYFYFTWKSNYLSHIKSKTGRTLYGELKENPYYLSELYYKNKLI